MRQWLEKEDQIRSSTKETLGGAGAVAISCWGASAVKLWQGAGVYGPQCELGRRSLHDAVFLRWRRRRVSSSSSSSSSSSPSPPPPTTLCSCRCLRVVTARTPLLAAKLRASRRPPCTERRPTQSALNVGRCRRMPQVRSALSPRLAGWQRLVSQCCQLPPRSTVFCRISSS